MNRRIQQIGKRKVRYYREPKWDRGFCWVFLVTEEDEEKHIYLGSITRTENPRRYNGKRYKADAAHSLIVKRIADLPCAETVPCS